MTYSAFAALLGLHTVALSRRLADGPTGPAYSAPAPFVCTVVEDTQATVGPNGTVIGTVTTMAYDYDTADRVNIGSRVTLPSGRVAEVISVSTSDGPGPFDGLAAGIAVLS